MTMEAAPNRWYDARHPELSIRLGTTAFAITGRERSGGEEDAHREAPVFRREPLAR